MTENGKPGLVVRDKSQTPVAVNEHGFEIRTIDEAWRWGAFMAKSGIFPEVTTPERALAVRQLANDNNVPFSTVGMNIAFINGRACMYGDALVGIAHANHGMQDFEETIDGEGDERTATCRVVRKGIETAIVRTFSVADAKKAHLWPGTEHAGRKPSASWSGYPDRMLQMRARSWALRDAGLVQGIIAREEAEDIPRQAEVISPAALPEPKPDASWQELLADKFPQKAREAEVVEVKTETPKEATADPERKCVKCGSPLGADLACPKCDSGELFQDEPGANG